MSKYYLRISRASDLKNRKERYLYRSFEMLPGVLTWATLAGAFVLSYYRPNYVAVFIITFVLYWLFKSIYFSFHMRAGYKRMQENNKINWLKKLEGLREFPIGLNIRGWKDIYQLVVLPMYKEPYEIVRETIASLASSDYPKKKIIVILSQEERAGEEIIPIAQKIGQEFKNKFFKFVITAHPADLPGEIAAKSSNETWAAKRGKEILDREGIAYEKVIFSPFDIDTSVPSYYFSRLTYKYLTVSKPLRTSYQPIALFLNNIWQAPAISRLFSFSSSFWHIINQERPEKLITFSSHSMPFKALVDVGFKQTDVVSDDSRIFWQCFLYYDGDYRVEPLYCPISMDANADKTLLRTIINIYKQQRRWAYGAGDIAYFLFGFLKNKKISLYRKFSLSFELIEGHWSWACASILLLFMGWLPVALGGDEFSQTMFSYNLPRMVGRALTFAMIGLFTSMYYTFYLLPPKPGKKKRDISVFLSCFQWLFLPLTMFFFTSLPAIDAQTRWLLARYMGFWVTPKHR
jgi:cellulose synthase/poly-beta-1,6-N-acetylglucosamine synthase-like glycosyltransferase